MRSEPGPWVLHAVPVDPTFDVDTFDCGINALNVYLARHAFDGERSAKVRTYVLAEGTRAIAYYSVVMGVVEAALSRAGIESRRRRQLVPVVLLSRIAVDVRRQGQGIGGFLAWQACGRGARAAGVVGARAVVATVIREEARSFFAKQGFAPFPKDRYRFYFPLKPGGERV